MPEWSDSPWEANEGKSEVIGPAPTGGYYHAICELRGVNPNERAGTGTSLANGRLISAAPWLYYALDDAVYYLRAALDGEPIDDANIEDAVGRAEDAMAKARGEKFT